VGRIPLGEPPVNPLNTRNPSNHALPGSCRVRYAGAEFRPTPDRELVALVLAARAGDSAAWTELLARFDRTLRSIAGSCRLAPADVDDVVQATWLDLLRDIDRVREPAGIAGWLGTATRRKAMRLLRARSREHLTDDVDVSDSRDLYGPEATALASELRAALIRAIATLPDRHRRLMTLLLTQPTLDYQQISERLAMPVGSIGPIRARSLARLSHHPELRALR
jgi:RNA polymerase sigma factor (sigma-70 family)